jgi:carbon starvation protein
MNAMPFVIGTIALFAIAYRLYFSFVAAKVAVKNDLGDTPAHRLYDGQNYYPMNKWVLFGHHFAAIAGAGPLVGPVEKLQAILPKLHAMGFAETNLGQLSASVGEKIAGRTGGAVSLGVGMAYIFSSVPGMKHLMSYWYHFAIMFEALFILTTIDAGTRIGRFLLQEALGKIYKPFQQTNWLPGNLLTSALIVFAWAYFIYTGSISTIWPMFGTANQLLATIALVIGTSFIINRGRAKYAWVTILPMTFVGVTTMTAAYLNIKNIYIPQVRDSGTMVPGLINLILTLCILICALVIIYNAVPKWMKVFRNHR